MRQLLCLFPGGGGGFLLEGNWYSTSVARLYR